MAFYLSDGDPLLIEDVPDITINSTWENYTPKARINGEWQEKAEETYTNGSWS